jgi:predicted XRE-type DNA-binding protein
MALTKRQRKLKLGRGGQKRVADKLGLSESTVSQVMNNKTQTLTRDTVLRVKVALAEEMGESFEEAWGEAAPLAAVA